MNESKPARYSIEWVARTFGLGQPGAVDPAGRGQKNPLGVLRLESSNGRFAVKRFTEEPRPAALAVESAAYASGFPMPTPVRTTGDEPYAVCSHEGSPIWVRVYSWVPGSAYDWGVVEPRLSFQVGGLLAALHALPVPADALREEPWNPLKHSGWMELSDAAASRAVAWAPVLRSMVATLVAWEERTIEWTVSDEPVVPSQRDLHPPNVIERPDGTQAVVDWDAAGPVSAREDVAKYAVVWASTSQGATSRDAVRAFLDGYRSTGGRFVSRGISDFRHHVQSLLSWTAYNVRRDLSDHPGLDPELTPALLSAVRGLDLDTLNFTAALSAE